jgi:hypothetical protein
MPYMGPELGISPKVTGREIVGGTALAGMGLLAAVQPEMIPVMLALGGLSQSAALPGLPGVPGKAFNYPFQQIEKQAGRVIPEETGIPTALSLALPLAAGVGLKYAGPKIAAAIPEGVKTQVGKGLLEGEEGGFKLPWKRGETRDEYLRRTVRQGLEPQAAEAPEIPLPKPPVPPPSELLPIAFDAPPTEKFTQSVNRLYHGALDAFGIRALDEYAQLGKVAKETKLPDVQYDRMNGTYSLPSKPNEAGLALIKALKNEGDVPAGYEAYYGAVRKIYADEEAAMASYPEVTAKFTEDPYSHIQYKLIPGPEQAKGGRLRPGATPSFLKRTTGKTIDEVLAMVGKNGERLELATHDPGKFALARRLAGEEYRQARILVERWRAAPSNEVLDLRRAVPQKEAPRDWRVPSIPAFSREGLAVSPADYRVIDKMFPLSSTPQTKVGQFFNKLAQNVRLAKVFLSPQQYIDLTTRGLGHAIGSRRVGDVPPAMMSLSRWLSPKARAAFNEYITTDPDIRLMTEQGLSLRAGQELASRSVLASAKGEDILGMPFIKEIPVPERLTYVKAVKDRLNGVSAFFQSGLYDYVYSGNMAAAAKGELAGVRAIHPDWAPAAQAAEAAKNLNIRFSSIPDWQSVLTDAPGGRQFYRNLMFGPVENEGLVRSWTEMIPFMKGHASKRLFLRYNAGMMLLNFSMAQMINKATTGNWLDPEDQLTPFKKGGVGLTMNSHFLRPQLPYRGPHGEIEYLDLLGQQDTIFRWLDPQQAIRTRLNILPGYGWAQMQKETYFGKPLGMPVGEGWQDKLRNQLQFGLETISPMGMSALLPGSSEAPTIGRTGGIIQAGGVNVSAEGLAAMRDRKARELGAEDYEHATREIQAKVAADPDIEARVALNRGKAQDRISAGIADVDEIAFEQLRIASDIYAKAIDKAAPQYLTNPSQADTIVRQARDNVIAQRFLTESTFPTLRKDRENYKTPDKPIEDWTPQEVFDQEMQLYWDATDRETGQTMPDLKDELYNSVDGLESQLTDVQFAQLQADLGAKDTPVMALRRQYLRELSEPKITLPDIPQKVSYYDIGEAVWARVRDTNFPDMEKISYTEFKRNLIEKYPQIPSGDVLQRNSVVKLVDKTATGYRQQLEHNVPLIPATLVAFGMRTNLRDEELKAVLPLRDQITAEIEAALQGAPK